MPPKIVLDSAMRGIATARSRLLHTSLEMRAVELKDGLETIMNVEGVPLVNLLLRMIGDPPAAPSGRGTTFVEPSWEPGYQPGLRGRSLQGPTVGSFQHPSLSTRSA